MFAVREGLVALLTVLEILNTLTLSKTHDVFLNKSEIEIY